MRRTKLKNLACCLAVASLAIRLVVSFLNVPAALAADIQHAGSLASLDIVICAPGTASYDGQSGSSGNQVPPDSEKLAKACPLCLSLAATDAALLATAQQVSSPMQITNVYRSFANDHVAARELCRATARAPPLFS